MGEEAFRVAIVQYGVRTKMLDGDREWAAHRIGV